MADSRRARRPSAAALRAFLLERGLSQRELAFAVNVSQQTISYWLRGVAAPDEHARKLLETVTEGRVTSSDWLTRNEARELERKEREAAAAATAIAAAATGAS